MNARLQDLAHQPELSFWFGRFQAFREADGTFTCRDRLWPPARKVARESVSGLTGDALALQLFRHGWVNPGVSAFGCEVRDRPVDEDDGLFWQYPCLTEAAAWQAHRALTLPLLADDALHVYLGLPWATWIDLGRKDGWRGAGKAAMAHQLQLIGVRIAGLRAALRQLGVNLRVHTVCQHIYWRDLLPTWRTLGVTDLWLSHCDTSARHDAGSLHVHPWSLFAVNVRDEQRRTGMTVAKPVEHKGTLASFIGAHSPHYLSDVRLRMRDLATVPGFAIRLTDKWHFEDVVYGEQIARSPAQDNNSHAVREYNELLSDSVFSLCPAGAGPNTLRLWESLAVGAIPVLLGPPCDLPEGGTLPRIDWNEIVIRVADDQISQLPAMLRAVPAAEIKARQKKAIAAYESVVAQRCF